MKRVHITFSCGDITLEGVWHLPQGSGPFPAVIVCHPHPLTGGSMSSNVVFGICQVLALESMAALRFNFRGVDKSQGKFGGSIAEQEDVRAALDFVSATPDIDPKRIGLAGYSFGAGVTLPVAVRDERVKMLALVSPALREYGGEKLKGYTRPKFIIIGEHDFTMPILEFRQYAEDILTPEQYEVIAGADHFWGGFEEEVAEKVAEFFADGLK